ncbi:MAG: hypothetical protein FD174_88 [Geobacteraceae bacterium]|nr:MAG: hypothetical protein FD174_88 [Geobacteraceae bacterium]
MVIGDLDIVGIAVIPSEAYPPLIVDPNAPLAIAVPVKLLQPVARGNAQEVKGSSAVELFQFALGNALNVMRQLCRKSAVKQLVGLFAGE